jgi:hypothetical protein
LNVSSGDDRLGYVAGAFGGDDFEMIDYLFLIFEVATDAKVPPNERAQQQE